MFDVVALGESLIDFTPNGTNAQGIELPGIPAVHPPMSLP